MLEVRAETVSAKSVKTVLTLPFYMAFLLTAY